MHTLHRIDPLSAARVVGISAALVSIIYVVIGVLVVAFTGMQFAMHDDMPAVGFGSLWLALLIPVGYLIGVFVTTYLICLIFNAVAGWFGGIRIELSDD